MGNLPSMAPGKLAIAVRPWCVLNGVCFQRGVFKTSRTVPKQVKKIMDEETFTKSRIYQLDKSSYSLVHGFYKQLEFLVSLA